MPPEPLRFVARVPRSGFGRLVMWLFWTALLLPPLLMMGTCAGLSRFVLSEDEEVALGALMFGAEALGWLWSAWLIGVPALFVLVLLTRGRRLVIEQHHLLRLERPPCGGAGASQITCGQKGRA